MTIGSGDMEDATQDGETLLVTPYLGAEADPAGIHGGLRSLLRLLLNQTPDVVGRARVLRFKGLRERLSGSSEAVRRLFHGITAAALEDTLSPTSAYARLGEDSYIVFLSADENLTGEELLHGVRRRLRQHFPGDWGLELWALAGNTPEGMLLRKKHAPAPDAGKPPAPERPKAPSGPSADLLVLADEDPGLVVMTDAELPYIPLWEVRRNRVYGYVCEPEWRLSADAPPLREDEIDSHFRSPEARLAMDLQILRHTAETIADLLAHDRAVTLVVPVHFESLADDDRRRRYMQACLRRLGGFSEVLSLEIRALPDPLGEDALALAARHVRPLCRDLLVRVPTGFERFDDLRNASVDVATLDLRGAALSELDAMAEMDRFTFQAGRKGLRSCVHGLSSISLTVAAVCAGFGLVGSDLVSGRLLDKPMSEHEIKPIDLFRKLKTSTRTPGVWPDPRGGVDP